MKDNFGVDKNVVCPLRSIRFFSTIRLIMINFDSTKTINYEFVPTMAFCSSYGGFFANSGIKPT